MRVGYPYRPDPKQRRRPGEQRDTRDFSGKGKYTPWPGTGPYPWMKGGPVAPPDGGEESLRGTEAEGWWRAPPESHLEAFRLVYPLGDDEPYVLQVRFRDGGEYEYYGQSGYRNTRLETIYEMMKQADHPGQLVWSSLIVEQFPYSNTISRG